MGWKSPGGECCPVKKMMQEEKNISLKAVDGKKMYKILYRDAPSPS